MPTKLIKVQSHIGVYYLKALKKRYLGRPDKCFYITYKINKSEKKVREKVGWASEGYTAQLASHVRAERIREIRHGNQLPNKNKRRLLLDDAWNLYDKWLDTGKSHPYDDRNRYKNYIKNKFGTKALSQITSHDIEQFKTSLIKKGLAPQTVKHILIIIRQVYNKMIAWGLYQGNSPTKGIKMPNIDNKRVRFLTAKEADKLLIEVKKRSQQLYEISLLSLHTGMRASEIFGLLWGHVDFKNGLIHVADSKGGKSRDVFLTKKSKEMLQEKKRGNRGDLVFVSRTGGKIGDVSKAFLRAVRKIGLNDGIKDRRQIASFHTLRHTFASWLALQGTPILEIKELLGHSTLAMTERYAHLIPDKKRESVEKMEQAFLDGIETR